jgi:hypothetical protein
MNLSFNQTFIRLLIHYHKQQKRGEVQMNNSPFFFKTLT